MPRTARASVGGICYHVLNRGNARARVFHDDKDYERFLKLFERASKSVPMRLVAWCVMPNHFHFVLWPHGDGDLGRFMHRWMSGHVHAHRRRHGTVGHVWQGRFKAFPIQQDGHLMTVVRYVERNALRANLVASAQAWSWSSAAANGPELPLESPVERHDGWLDWVNAPQSESELRSVRASAQRERPYGDTKWTNDTVQALGLGFSMRAQGNRRAPGHSDCS